MGVEVKSHSFVHKIAIIPYRVNDRLSYLHRCVVRERTVIDEYFLVRYN